MQKMQVHSCERYTGEFLHKDMDESMPMILEGTISKLIIKLELNLYREHIWYNQKGKPMPYVQLKKHYMKH